MIRAEFHPKIIHKGMALVLIPLIVNTVWVIVLSGCLAKTEALVESERTRSIVLQHINNCIINFAETLGAMANYLTLGDKRYRREGQRRISLLRKDLAILKEIGKTDPSVGQIIDETLRTANFQFRALEELEAPQGEQSMPQMFARFKTLTRFLSNLGYKNELLQKYVQQHQLELDEIRRKEASARQLSKTIVTAGLVANFLVAIALASMFVSNITTRLSILVENALCLPKRLSLKRRVKGNDELKDLDTALHLAAEELANAHEFRRSLMQMMAHDLRSPLSSCAISLDLLEQKNRQALAADSLNQIRSMHSSIERLLNLINNLLLIEGLELNQIPLDPAPENLRELCDTAIQSIIGLAEAKELTIVNLVDVEYLVVDRERILQVLVNYLSNAIKFSPRGSKIQTQKIVEHDSLKIIVADEGPGLSETEAASLFRKFHQLKEGKKAGGSGLGLAISKLIVESHGGNVGVESVQGQGARFWLSLPITK